MCRNSASSLAGRGTVSRYGRSIFDSIDELSPLVSSALDLLDQPRISSSSSLPTLAETAQGLRADGYDLDWRLDLITGHDGQSDSDKPTIRESLSSIWDKVPAKDLTFGAAALFALGTIKGQSTKPTPRFEPSTESNLWDGFKHNIIEGNSVVGGLITGRVTNETRDKIISAAPDVADTLTNAVSEMSALNPSSLQGASLLTTDTGRFFENYATFANGAKDFVVDNGKIAAALTIASNPTLNAAYAEQFNTNAREEINAALVGAATLAAQDPDTFATTVIDWETLKQDPIRWAGNQAPELVLELVTAGGGAVGVSRRLTAKTVIDLPSPGADSAVNVANHVRYVDELPLREAASAFDSNGALHPEIIANSRIAMEGVELGNPKVIATLTSDGSRISDWAKYSTRSINSPSGEFQVHYYRNKVTNEVNLEIDYKVKFNGSKKGR